VPQNDDQLDLNPEYQFLFELLALNGTKYIEGTIDE
jgi:hypothetical protein